MRKSDFKNVIVTGAAKGIGKAIVARLISENYFVIAADYDEVEGKKLPISFGEDNVSFFKVDISNENSVKIFFEQVIKKYSAIYTLVNNAGIIRDKMIWKMSMDDFDAVINVNLRGTWLMCREAAKIMREQKGGRIINISSRAWLGNAGQSNYSSSKAGIVALTRVLALELGKYNILVNAIAPGLIDTPLTQNLEKDVLQKLIDAQPTKTMGKPEDVAHVVSFLANEKTNFVTGQVYYVDGGKSMSAEI